MTRHCSGFDRDSRRGPRQARPRRSPPPSRPRMRHQEHPRPVLPDTPQWVARGWPGEPVRPGPCRTPRHSRQAQDSRCAQSHCEPPNAAHPSGTMPVSPSRQSPPGSPRVRRPTPPVRLPQVLAVPLPASSPAPCRHRPARQELGAIQRPRSQPSRLPSPAGQSRRSRCRQQPALLLGV